MRVACISVQKEKMCYCWVSLTLHKQWKNAPQQAEWPSCYRKRCICFIPQTAACCTLDWRNPLEVAATSRASSNGACYRSETRPAKPGVFGKKGLKQPKWRPTWRRPSDDVPQRSQRVATEDQGGALCETVCVKSSKKHGDRSKPKPCGEHRRN